jgi:hypothetical protein
LKTDRSSPTSWRGHRWAAKPFSPLQANLVRTIKHVKPKK